MAKTYHSKISFGLLAFVFVVFFGSLVPNIIASGFTSEMWYVFTGVACVYVCIVYLFFNTTYTITDQELHIKCGFFKYKPIAIASIKSISKTSSLLSSPAASFDRIEIKYGKFDEIIISPKDKVNFAKALKAIHSDIDNKIVE